METTVDKLEAMFQKSEADLVYIEKRLKLEFVTNATENGSHAEGNPATLLENLAEIKARYAALCSQVKEMASVQKESMDSIRTYLDGTLQMVQLLNETADTKVLPVSELEQEATSLLRSSIIQNTTRD
ncbi:spindle and kinetochore-associated protein 2 [Lampris incognitus]|uniref:spindle and kinetochore-associated protein 2 n=1 Tax=Lampris incognitus TaxID=2546036 RepID=UPI0024B5D90B|nr:spindle and kinetochore-associated protein 2 [Lampris incognitus]